MAGTTITGTRSIGVTLKTPGYVDPVSVIGTITVSNNYAIGYRGGTATAWTIVNSGLVSGTGPIGSGIVLGSSGTTITNGVVTNQSGGRIYGYVYGISLYGQGTVTNLHGTISAGNFGITIKNAGTVSNLSGGVISGINAEAVVINGVISSSSGAQVYNAGTMIGGSFGIDEIQGGSVTNAAGGVISAANSGIEISGPGSVTNMSGGQISSGSGSAIYIYGKAGATLGAQIYNAGTLAGSSFGIETFFGSSVTNAAGGTIGAQTGPGVFLDGPSTLINGGLITSSSTGVKGAVVLYEGGTLQNLPSGTISGYAGVYLSTFGSTFTNAGTVIATGSNGLAVNFHRYNNNSYTLAIDPGAVFVGGIYGGNGVLELAAGTGTLAGVGTSITNFTTLTFDPAANWSISGDVAGLTTLTAIGGFTSHDTIDLTDFAAVSGIFSNGALTLTDSVSAQVMLHFQGAFGSTSFNVAPDGRGGTDIILPQTLSWVDGSADWTTPADWSSGTVPSSAESANIGKAGSNTVSIAPADNIAIANIAIGGASDVLAVNGTLSPSGTVAIAAGHISLSNTGAIIGGVIADNTGTGLLSSAGTLNAVTSNGPLNLTTNAEELVIVNGLTAFGLGGSGAGSISLTEGGDAIIDFQGSQTIDNAMINLNGTDASDPRTEIDSGAGGSVLTLGANLTIISTAKNTQAILGSSGSDQTAVDNEGTIIAAAAHDGSHISSFTISPANGLINDGTVLINNGDALNVTSAINAGTGNGTIGIGTNGDASFAAAVATDQTLIFSDATGTLTLLQPGSFGATMNGFQAGDTIELAGISATGAVWTAGSPGTLAIDDDGNPVATLSILGNYSKQAFVVTDQGNNGTAITVTATCFGAGTRILTPRGEVAVERLREGDLVLTESGRLQPVLWIGHRHVDFRRHDNRQRVLPVRIRAHAFGRGRPKRALLLSPDHAVFVDRVLIPIRHLINEGSIAQIDCDEVTYYHIELPRHDVVLADGLPAESYLEAGARAAFSNGDCVVQFQPDFAPTHDKFAMLWEAQGYAALVIAGPRLERIRRKLALPSSVWQHAA